MTRVTPLATAFEVDDSTLSPGTIFRKLDGSLWKVNPNGSQSPLTSGGGDPTMGGDISGPASAAVVDKINGVAVTLGGGAENDVVTQQADGSFAPAPGGGSQPLERFDIEVTFADIGAADEIDLSTLDAAATLNPGDIVLAASAEVTVAFNDSEAASGFPQVYVGEPDGSGANIAANADAMDAVVDAAGTSGLLSMSTSHDTVYPGSAILTAGIVQVGAAPVALWLGTQAALAGDGAAGTVIVHVVILRAS